MNISEFEYEKMIQEAGLSFWEKYGECPSCLYGVDDPCECEALKKKYQEFNKELERTK